MNLLNEDDLFPSTRQAILLAPGAFLLGGLALKWSKTILSHIHHLDSLSPFRHMVTPGGKTMSVAMINCGSLGWVSDRNGYRYCSHDPLTGQDWPDIPQIFLKIAQEAASKAGYHDFVPDACLINKYLTGSRLTLHQDKDEHDLSAPIISVSLGLSACFLWGGLTRHDKVKRIALHHGDVVVWGGSSRLFFHGIDTIKAGNHPSTGSLRYNLTFRKVM